MHRDLKSANVFLNKNGSAKLGDMNVSKVIIWQLFNEMFNIKFRLVDWYERSQLYPNRNSILCKSWSLEGSAI